MLRVIEADEVLDQGLMSLCCPTKSRFVVLGWCLRYFGQYHCKSQEPVE
jgi:hypothetical protein